MPSWKKVILSGSDAALNTLSVSNSITASVISASQFTGSLFGTASWATNVNTASWANNVSTASWANNVNTASWANNATNASTASWASNVNTASWANNATNASTASWASNVNTASWANNVSTASWANNINTASWAQSASHALNARTASWASNVNTASWANNVSTASWASNINTASWANNALTASWANNVNTASWAQSASHALNARTASWASNVNTASWATNVNTASWASNVNTASWANNVSTASWANNVNTASWANNVNTASLASRNLLTASVSSNIITFTKGDGSTFPITVNTGSGGTSFTGNQYEVAYFSSSNTTPEGALYITAYPIQSEGVALRVGRNEPTETSSSGSHILKDNRELFTNAKLAAASEPFVLLGFGGKGNVDLTATDNYEHPGINNYSDFTPGKVYNGSLKLRNTLYGIQDVDGNTKLVADGGFVAKPSSPGFLLGQGGFYIFDSASMQFNASGGLISPVASASVRLTLATDSSSLSIAVGKNNLTDVLYISRSGDDARIAVGGNYRTPRNTLDISGSLRVFTSVTASIISASSITSSLFGTSSWAINALTASFLPVATYNITASWASNINTASWAQTSSHAINARSSSWATNALTASFVNTLNQGLIITGAVSIGTGSIGPNENTLTLGARDAVSEGGQLGLNAPGGTYTSASFIDLYQNRFRVLRGTNVSSDAELFSINLHTGQFVFNRYTGSGAFPGTANGYLAIDTAGNVITSTGAGGSTTPGGSNTQIQYNNSNAFGGVPTLTYDGTTLRATGSFTGSFTGSLFGTASWALNVVGGGGGGATFPYTGSAIISGSLTVTGSTAITGGFDALGTRGSRIQLGTYNVGYDLVGVDTLYITGAGLIVSGNMPDQNHHNFLKIGNVEMVDVNTAVTTNEFLIHNVNTLRITSGADGGNITTNNQLLKIGGGEFYVYRAGSGDSAGVIQSISNTTKIADTLLDLYGSSGSYFYIPNTNEITILDGTDYLMGFANDPSSPGSSLTYKIKANKFIWVTGSSQIISGGLTITGSLAATSFTGSLLGTSSWATNALTASFLPVGTYNITASWAQSASNAVNARTASFISNLNQDLSITGAVILSGSSLPELRVIGETQFTGSVGSTGGFTGSLLGTSSWANNATTASYILNAISSSFSLTASFTPNAIITASVNSNIITFTKGSGTTFSITVSTGSGGGGGVTINNNVDTYLVTATGTANTLDGEPSLTFDGTTLTVGGNAVITAIDTRNDPSTTIGDYAPGSHIARDWPAAGGPALTAGNIVYFSGSSQWTNAQANATGSSTRVLGVVTSNTDPNEIVLQGTVTINTDLASYSVGQPVYLSPISGGRVTNIPPSSSGHVARYVGWVVDTSRDQIYFNPDFTYIQL